MAHEIETFDDGTAAFFTARQDAWHRLGVTTRDCLTAEQVMATARLGGWNVHTVPLTATDLTADGVTTAAGARPLRHRPHPPRDRQARRPRGGRLRLHRGAERGALRTA